MARYRYAPPHACSATITAERRFDSSVQKMPPTVRSLDGAVPERGVFLVHGCGRKSTPNFLVGAPCRLAPHPHREMLAPASRYRQFQLPNSTAPLDRFQDCHICLELIGVVLFHKASNLSNTAPCWYVKAALRLRGELPRDATVIFLLMKTLQLQG